MFKKLFILLIIHLPCTWNSMSQTGANYGNKQQDIAFGLTEYKNNFYVVGTTREDFQSSTNFFVLELYNNGSIKKQYSFGKPHQDIGKDIIVDDDGLFVLGKVWDGGNPNNDMFLTRLNHNGEEVWHKYYGGQHNDLGHKFRKTHDNSFLMAGFNRSVDDFGDAYIVKADKNGDTIWTTHFGDRYVDHAFDVIETPKKEIIAVGTKGGFYNPTSTDYWNSDADIFVVKLSARGDIIWEKTFGGESHDWAKAIVAAPDGAFYICGSTQSSGEGSFDMLLMKIDDDGNELWSKTFGGADFDYGESLKKGTDNSLYLLGTSASYSDDFKPDHLLIKTDLNGEEIWSETYGGVNSDYSSAMIATQDSGVAFTGWTKEGSNGREDIVFYRIAKNGKPKVISSLQQINDSVKQIKLYPNPAKTKFSIFIDSLEPDQYEVSIFNMNGSVVYKDTIPTQKHVPVSPFLSSGVYIVHIHDRQQVIFNQKLMIR